MSAGRREQTDAITEFSLHDGGRIEGTGMPLSSDEEYEVLSSTVPAGVAVINTGCTASVVGAATAKRYAVHFRNRGLPQPGEISLPPVQLKGFNRVRSTAQSGLKWLVKSATSDEVCGSAKMAPFLLSQKVLQGMEATKALAANTISSTKHGMSAAKLAPASNGHLLLPLVPEAGGEETFEVCPRQPKKPSEPVESTQVTDSKAPLQKPGGIFRQS